ncbi:hypothetical protein D5086_027712 [Populus alba]|uniref:Uncharacterized protein n=1 Tax=Populus alba TaxID=43335 RepID=A0ACC4AW47_POPAL
MNMKKLEKERSYVVVSYTERERMPKPERADEVWRKSEEGRTDGLRWKIARVSCCSFSQSLKLRADAAF